MRLEHKIFLVELGQAGTRVHVTERTRTASYHFVVDLGGARWLWEQIVRYAFHLQSGNSFNRARGKSGVLSVHKFINKKGSFLEITKHGQQGFRQCIILPSGRNFWGWRRFAYALGSYVANPKINQPQIVGGARAMSNRAPLFRNVPPQGPRVRQSPPTLLRQ